MISFLWQGAEYENQTFDDEVNFELYELDSIYETLEEKMLSLTFSELYDQNTFYKAFLRDLRKAKTRVIIESPFITQKRMKLLFPTLMALRHKGVRIIVNTKPLEEHSLPYKYHTLRVIASMQNLDIEVLRTVGHHRKLTIIDEDVLW